MRIYTTSGIIIRLAGVGYTLDTILLLNEVCVRTPDLLLGYRLDGEEHNVVYAVRAGELVVDSRMCARLNNRTETGTFVPAKRPS